MTKDFEFVPIVDISGLSSEDVATRQRVAAQMGAAEYTGPDLVFLSLNSPTTE